MRWQVDHFKHIVSMQHHFTSKQQLLSSGEPARQCSGSWTAFSTCR